VLVRGDAERARGGVLAGNDRSWHTSRGVAADDAARDATMETLLGA